jgi:hypothetical protein
MLAYLVPFLLLGGAIQIARRHVMTKTESVPSAVVESHRPSRGLSSPVASSTVASLPADVIRLLDVFARIELRRRRERLLNFWVAPGAGASEPE